MVTELQPVAATSYHCVSKTKSLRLCAVSTLAANKIEAQQRINRWFAHDRLGSPLPDMWDAHSVYIDGLAGNDVVYSGRLVLPSKFGLPIDRHFDSTKLRLGQPCAEISHFTVLPHFRRKIAVYDWQSVQDHVRKAGCHYLIAESLIRLERFYRRLGFLRCGDPFVDATIGVPASSTAVNAVPMLMKL